MCRIVKKVTLHFLCNGVIESILSVINLGLGFIVVVVSLNGNQALNYSSMFCFRVMPKVQRIFLSAPVLLIQDSDIHHT